MDKLELFFSYCAGVTLSVLKRCPTDTSKYVSIGAAVFFTGLLAAISSAYAVHFVFDGLILPTLFGLIWGLMIFNLDRLIIQSMRKSERLREFYQAIPRLILAIFIGVVVSKPLELKIFEKEIGTELELIREELLLMKEKTVRARYSAKTDSLQQEIEIMQLAISEKEDKRDRLLEMARQEADGTGGSGKMNPGPIYAIKKKNADQAQLELDEMKSSYGSLIEFTRGELANTVQDLNKALRNVKVEDFHGVSFQLTALERLGNKYSAIYYTNIFVVLLFIMLEIAPIISKLLAPRGPYDDLLEVHEKRFESYRKAKVFNEEKRIEELMTPQATSPL